jgi:hypothetical protein
MDHVQRTSCGLAASTPDQVHQLYDEAPVVAASQSAIGSGSVPHVR